MRLTFHVKRAIPRADNERSPPTSESAATQRSLPPHLKLPRTLRTHDVITTHRSSTNPLVAPRAKRSPPLRPSPVAWRTPPVSRGTGSRHMEPAPRRGGVQCDPAGRPPGRDRQAERSQRRWTPPRHLSGNRADHARNCADRADQDSALRRTSREQGQERRSLVHVRSERGRPDPRGHAGSAVQLCHPRHPGVTTPPPAVPEHREACTPPDLRIVAPATDRSRSRSGEPSRTCACAVWAGPRSRPALGHAGNPLGARSAESFAQWRRALGPTSGGAAVAGDTVVHATSLRGATPIASRLSDVTPAAVNNSSEGPVRIQRGCWPKAQVSNSRSSVGDSSRAFTRSADLAASPTHDHRASHRARMRHVNAWAAPGADPFRPSHEAQSLAIGVSAECWRPRRLSLRKPPRRTLISDRPAPCDRTDVPSTRPPSRSACTERALRQAGRAGQNLIRWSLRATTTTSSVRRVDPASGHRPCSAIARPKASGLEQITRADTARGSTTATTLRTSSGSAAETRCVTGTT